MKHPQIAICGIHTSLLSGSGATPAMCPSVVSTTGLSYFDADGLAQSIASIIRNNPEAADEFIFYLLIILDAVGGAAPQNVKQVIDQSVRSAFQFTETFEAALDLYVLCQRGLLGGSLPARDLIREMVTSRGLKNDGELKD